MTEEKRNLKWLWVPAFLIAGIFVGFGLGKLTNFGLKAEKKVNSQDLDDYSKNCELKFVNPLRCEYGLISPLTELAPVKDKLLKFIESQKRQGNITHASIYFRDLHNGPIIAIDEDELFTAASLLKVPVMVLYYKLAEEGKISLSQKIGENFVPGNPNLNTSSAETILPKTAYSIEELIYKMIVYSDNSSKELLVENLAKIDPSLQIYLQTFNDLGLFVDTSTIEDYLTVKRYASIFRILYNAAYLNTEMSEKALNLLDQVEFKDGLVAGVPGNIDVAHKFGVRDQANGEHQLHDCGIIYYPGNHYLLCVMTRGEKTDKNAKVISEISRILYDEIDRRVKTQ